MCASVCVCLKENVGMEGSGVGAGGGGVFEGQLGAAHWKVLF